MFYKRKKLRICCQGNPVVVDLRYKPWISEVLSGQYRVLIKTVLELKCLSSEHGFVIISSSGKFLNLSASVFFPVQWGKERPYLIWLWEEISEVVYKVCRRMPDLIGVFSGLLGVTTVFLPQLLLSPLFHHSLLLIPGPDSRQVVFLHCWLFGLCSGSSCFGILVMFLVYLQKSMTVKKMRKGEKEKGYQEWRDGRDQEERTLSCDLKLDDMLDYILEDWLASTTWPQLTMEHPSCECDWGSCIGSTALSQEAKGNN